jgi:hypothetical protein
MAKPAGRGYLESLRRDSAHHPAPGTPNRNQGQGHGSPTSDDIKMGYAGLGLSPQVTRRSVPATLETLRNRTTSYDTAGKEGPWRPSRADASRSLW